MTINDKKLTRLTAYIEADKPITFEGIAEEIKLKSPRAVKAYLEAAAEKLQQPELLEEYKEPVEKGTDGDTAAKGPAGKAGEPGEPVVESDAPIDLSKLDFRFRTKEGTMEMLQLRKANKGIVVLEARVETVKIFIGGALVDLNPKDLDGKDKAEELSVGGSKPFPVWQLRAALAVSQG